MRFADGLILNYLWLAVPLILTMFMFISFRKKVLSKFVEVQLLEKIASNYSAQRQTLKFVLLYFVFIFSILALARPQWGFEWQEVKRQGVDVLLAIDTSKSMLTADIKPNRLERTKLAVEDLLRKLKGDRIGLIAFSGDAFLVCPLTVDYGGFYLSLRDLNTETVPRGGTNVAEAIEESLKSYEKIANKYKAVIVITDGEELEGNALELAQKAKAQGVKIYTVGVGTKEGELIQFINDQGQKEFLKDAQGNFVKSRLNENLLERIAAETGGIYVRASGSQFGLDLIYEQELSKMEKRKFDAKMEKKYFDRFQIPLAVALILLLIETCLSTRIQSKFSL